MVRTIKHRHTGGSVPAIFVWDGSMYANALWGIFVPQLERKITKVYNW